MEDFGTNVMMLLLYLAAFMLVLGVGGMIADWIDGRHK